MPLNSIKTPVTASAPTKTVALYDTTLRDGGQSEDIHFTVVDKIRIAERLDAIGIDYIEGGWPGANPTDNDFFQQIKQRPLRHARLVAFGSTKRSGTSVAQDPMLQGLLRAETSAITLFGKSWTLHVSDALGIELPENLAMIHDSIRFLKERVDTVFFDAEHFFDGFKANPAYAQQVLQTAHEAGADCLVLCDTNGGCLVREIDQITAQIAQQASVWGAAWGIHCHNDAELAVANSLTAVHNGATQVQGTINGIGERCGNANLVSIIPNLLLKMACRTGISQQQLTQLTRLSRYVDEITNRVPQKNQAFVGTSAFAHKGGIHVSAVLKNTLTYEHIDPKQVGNQQRVLISDQSGRSNLLYKLQELGFNDLDSQDRRLNALLDEIKLLEHRGFQFAGAEASFELRAMEAFGQLPDYFQLRGFRVIDERRVNADNERTMGSEATVKLLVDGRLIHLVDEGTGPVDALHTALCRALEQYYPQVNAMHLVDYKVRILSNGGSGGTDAKVRVLTGWQDDQHNWGTVGVSDHIIAASYDAMVDAVRYKLYKDGVSPTAEKRTGVVAI
ncbi:MAG: citramalate synthase [Magnetococcales bacterium]|nr:citramalate synthase [Magnetococcales bacterium]MBF0116260.1 citramalate synthase [Magnetococcales bacterium]